MPSLPDRAFHEWSDIGANFLRASNWIAAGGSLVSLYAALQNASNANLLYETAGTPIVGTVSPSPNTYPLVTDLALFNFQTVPGGRCQLIVPSPLAALFGPSGDVVDPSATESAAIIAAAVGLLTDVVGNPAVAFISGSKASRRTEQVSA
jgi:hypothetical protein